MCRKVHAQRVDFTYKTYGIEVDADNVIQNAGHLEKFFEGLYQLQLANDRKINIVHIGDSHIQADYMTSVIRRNFHRHFGNAGRGLIVPLRVARTNEPNNFKTVSDHLWESKRCVFPDQPLPIGIGGVTIETKDPEANLQIFMNDLWLDYSFNQLTLFYEKDETSFDFSIRDVQGTELGRISNGFRDSSRNHALINWENGINAVSIQPMKANPEQSRAILYGVVLENSLKGVLYHTIGVNGAKYKHYNEAARFAEQTAALQTDLFIISLGTNESIDYPYMDRSFSAQINELLSSLRAKNPMAAFILVTPQDVFRRRNKPNPGITEVRDEIIQYAVENGLAFYDLYRAMGGEHSAKTWRDNALLGADGIHLTKDGYEYQGNLFYHALLKGYNSYVPARHP
ncbi:MAG: GDSL-type esterase/lipase family protein [Cyclobacteriaceae bacterium]